MVGLSGSTAECGLQVGYTIADIVAKVGLGIFIYTIAMAKSEAEGYNEQSPVRAASV
jgi:hypothetical protein